MRTSFGWNADRYGSFHSWVNAWVAGETVWSFNRNACHTWVLLQQGSSLRGTISNVCIFAFIMHQLFCSLSDSINIMSWTTSCDLRVVAANPSYPDELMSPFSKKPGSESRNLSLGDAQCKPRSDQLPQNTPGCNSELCKSNENGKTKWVS